MVFFFWNLFMATHEILVMSFPHIPFINGKTGKKCLGPTVKEKELMSPVSKFHRGLFHRARKWKLQDVRKRSVCGQVLESNHSRKL